MKQLWSLIESCGMGALIFVSGLGVGLIAGINVREGKKKGKRDEMVR